MRNRKRNRQEENSILTFTDSDGNEQRFEYLDVIEYKDKEYIFLLPAESESTELIIMEIEPVNRRKENYLPVEDEALLQKVYGLFKEKYKDILTFSD